MRVARALMLLTLLSAAGWVAAQSVEVTFVNRTGATIYFLYASRSDSDTWGNDLLGSTVLPDGAVFRARLRSGNLPVDVRAVDANDNEYIVWSWDPGVGRLIITPEAFAGVPAAPSSSAAFSWVRVVNETNYDVEQIHVAPATSDSWDAGEQVLRGGQWLFDGEDFLVELDPARYDTLVFDIMLIDVDGDSYIKWDVNLELVTEVVFTLDDLVW